MNFKKQKVSQSDGFESGDLTAWMGSATDQGDLMVNAVAAMTGSLGMEAMVDDNNSLFVMYFSPQDETRFKAGFQFDPNSTSMSNGDALYLFDAAQCGGYSYPATRITIL